MNIYDFSYTSITGKEIPLTDYKDKVLLIVNTASKCGFTYQYKGLETLYQTHKNDGLVVIGFPCNQFHNQDPQDEAHIQQFCEVNYGVSFPLSSKVDVNGKDALPLFNYLKETAKFEGFEKGFSARFLHLINHKSKDKNSIKWNFTKFLVNRKGDVIKRYESVVTPEEIEADIKKELANTK